MLGKMEKEIGKWRGLGGDRYKFCRFLFLFSNFDFSKSFVGGSVFKLLDITLLDLLHESFAVKKIAFQVDGQLAGNDENLIVGDLRERDRAARGN